MTIERVNLTKEQLNNSLFEYEKHKSLNKYSTESQKTNKKLNEEKFKLKINTTIDRLEQERNKFRNSAEISTKPKLKEFKNLNKEPSISLAEIAKQRKLIAQRLESVLNENTSRLHSPKEASQVENLNDLYKWTEVTPNEEQAVVGESEEHDFNLFNTLYSRYFTQYYKHYLNKI